MSEPIEIVDDEMEIVDPITQLAWMLVWDQDYTDEFKRQVIQKAIAHANYIESMPVESTHGS